MRGGVGMFIVYKQHKSWYGATGRGVVVAQCKTKDRAEEYRRRVCINKDFTYYVVEKKQNSLELVVSKDVKEKKYYQDYECVYK